jgi:ABC-type maltose transport system permease subunit
MTPPAKKENYELLLYRLDQIDRKLDEMSKNYVTKLEFEDFKDVVHKELKRKSFGNWINPIIASISTAMITFLLVEFIRNQ